MSFLILLCERRQTSLRATSKRGILRHILFHTAGSQQRDSALEHRTSDLWNKRSSQCPSRFEKAWIMLFIPSKDVMQDGLQTLWMYFGHLLWSPSRLELLPVAYYKHFHHRKKVIIRSHIYESKGWITKAMSLSSQQKSFPLELIILWSEFFIFTNTKLRTIF